MLFGQKITVETLEINHAYDHYLKHDDEIILLCADENSKFDINHIEGAQCFPLRIIDKQAKEMLDPDYTYYIYAIREGTAFEATKKLLKLGFKAYSLGPQVDFKGPEEGLGMKKKRIYGKKKR